MRTGTHLKPTFFLSPIIDATSDDIPAAIHISQIPTISRRCCRQCELYQVHMKRQKTLLDGLLPALAGSQHHMLTMIGPTGTNASYTRRASSTLHAWKVICRQQQPIPKPMASIYIWSGFAAPFLASAPFSSVKSVNVALRIHTWVLGEDIAIIGDSWINERAWSINVFKYG